MWVLANAGMYVVSSKIVLLKEGYSFSGFFSTRLIPSAAPALLDYWSRKRSCYEYDGCVMCNASVIMQYDGRRSRIPNAQMDMEYDSSRTEDSPLKINDQTTNNDSRTQRGAEGLLLHIRGKVFSYLGHIVQMALCLAHLELVCHIMGSRYDSHHCWTWRGNVLDIVLRNIYRNLMSADSSISL